MSTKATKAELDWVVDLVERHQGYTGFVLQGMVAGYRFDRIHLKLFGQPSFTIEQLDRVTKVRAWLEQAKRKGRLVFKDSSIRGDYYMGDLPNGYYTVTAKPADVIAEYERERFKYLADEKAKQKEHENDLIRPELRDINRVGVMEMADKL